MYALLDAFRGPHRDPEQFDAVTEFLRSAEIFRRDRRNAFDVNRALRDLAAESEAGKYRKFLRGIVTINIEGRVGFRVTQPLRVLQAFGERQAFLFHPGQDVIAGAVEEDR